MWDVLDYIGMELTRIYQSCEFVKLYNPAFPTVIGMVGSLLFYFGAICMIYMDIVPLSATTESFSLFSIFRGGDR